MSNPVNRYLLTGILTCIPIMVTVLIVSFFIDLLTQFGRPKVLLIARSVQSFSPELARSLIEVPWLQGTLAILLTLALFYLLGWSVSRLLGQRILNGIEALVDRIPLVTTIYGATKQLLDAFNKDRHRTQRVVLIDFPREKMKTVGFVTRIMHDEDNGGELAAVYVPTAPNPTSGYLVIVPVADLVPLDWTIDQAMTFVVAGGSTAPPTIPFHRKSLTSEAH